MIFYFSATGNDLSVAQRLAEATGDKPVSITSCMREGAHVFELAEDENLGFVTPTYFWGLPSIVCDFIEQLQVDARHHYVYHVLTCGVMTGMASTMMSRRLKTRGIDLDAVYSVRMVDTWTPIFDCSDAEQNLWRTRMADHQIASMAEDVIAQECGDLDHHRGLLSVLSPVVYPFYRLARHTSSFRITDACIGCGRCASACPVSAIAMVDGKPRWTSKSCTLCLGCLHRCPKFAIRYGIGTARHGQFVNPDARDLR